MHLFLAILNPHIKMPLKHSNLPFCPQKTQNKPQKQENLQVRPKKAENINGWGGLLAIIGIIFISKNLIKSLLRDGMLLELPLKGLEMGQILWFFLTTLVTILNSFLSIVFLTPSLFLVELAVFLLTMETLVISKITYTYLHIWTQIFMIIITLKALSYSLSIQDSNRDANISRDNTNGDASISRDNNNGDTNAPVQDDNSNSSDASMHHDSTSIAYHHRSSSRIIKSFLKFLPYPVIVYRRHYSLKATRSFLAVLSLSLQLLCFYFLFSLVYDQSYVPSLHKIINEPESPKLLETFINLSLSSTILFFLFFLIVFRCVLGILSELTRFNEPTYLPWWNSKSCEEFWSKWNLPVHEFIKVHIYIPLVKKDLNKSLCKSICFIISGIAHEIVVSFAVRRVTGWFFLAMVSQIPYLFMDKLFSRIPSAVTNCVFWISICVVGQPFVAIMFVR